MEANERINALKNQADLNLFDYLVRHSPWADDDVIISFYTKPTSFRQFKSRVMKIAEKLVDCGLKKGDRVTISLVSSPESVELMYACCYLGVVPVLADLRLSITEMKELCEETGSRIVFISDFRGSELFGISEVPCVEKVVIVSICDGISPLLFLVQKPLYLFKKNPYFIQKHFLKNICEWKQFMSSGTRGGSLPPAASGESEMLFTTSGTTGKRKYVRLTAKQVNLAVCQHIMRFDYSEVKTTLSVMPLFTCYGFMASVHLPLVSGNKLIIHPIYKPESLPHVMLKYKPNAFSGVISHWEELMAYKKASREDFSYLKVILFGGDRCTQQKLDDVNGFLASHGCRTKLCQGYGMTEVTAGATVQDPDQYVSASVGKPLPLVQICITYPDTIRPLPAGQTGEICIHTPCQTKGYFNNPEATENLIRRHEDGLDWVHSGDLGHLDKDGNLYFDGRIKGMIVSSSGTKLFLPVLQAHAEKLTRGQCCAVALPDNRHEYLKRIILFAAPSPGSPRLPGKRYLAAALREALPMYILPDKIVYLKRLPLTSSGKTDVRELEDSAQKIIGGTRHITRRRLK